MSHEKEEFEKWHKSGIPQFNGELRWCDVQTPAWDSWQACAELKEKHIAELAADAKFNQAKFEGAIQANTQIRAERDALKAKLEAIEKQEPVAEVTSDCSAGLYDILPLGTLLYSLPPLRELSDNEIHVLWHRAKDHFDFARAILAEAREIK